MQGKIKSFVKGYDGHALRARLRHVQTLCSSDVFILPPSTTTHHKEDVEKVLEQLTMLRDKYASAAPAVGASSSSADVFATANVVAETTMAQTLRLAQGSALAMQRLQSFMQCCSQSSDEVAECFRLPAHVWRTLCRCAGMGSTNEAQCETLRHLSDMVATLMLEKMPDDQMELVVCTRLLQLQAPTATDATS